ncbi:glycoside hydrolase family 88/105 protein [Roseibium salinum]|uniref:Glycoside hydrolase family 88 protein n=1 Tax=Roseibium salinum TaxID=1604349 RepID=A0ABT3R7U0_9HYPH|nr:glycoside hydrolase family 88 protein [Roseibium sp. DSM 29163]MCX2725222.1 glycoside hydrolase family 88 protein [Roseibium sp. DSM 29163]
MLTEFFERYVTVYQPYKGGNWCYEDGLIYRGLELLHMATGDNRWLSHLKRLVDARILSGPRLSGYALTEYNIDNIRPGGALLYLDMLTGDPRYLACADLLADQLASHPRTKSGVYWHKARYPWQIWLDGLYMAAPFQIAYAHARNQPELISDSLNQIGIALKATYVPETGLYAHAFDEARKQDWADPWTGRSQAHWARALGWLCMCLVDVADLVGPAAFAPLRQRTTDLLNRILELRTQNGLWLQVIDAPDLEGNYIESSASAMFVYALKRAERLDLIGPVREDLLSGLIDYSVRKAPDGAIRMSGICEVAGLGGFEEKYRDGTPEYYLSEPVVDNDPKGVGPLMMCVATSLMDQPARSTVAAP